MHTISDENMRAIRARLLSREAELNDRVRRIEDDLSRKVAPLPTDAPEAAVVMENDETLQAIGESARAELRQIERALRLIDAGTYGVCEECAKPIGDARLAAVPYATHCKHCAKDEK